MAEPCIGPFLHLAHILLHSMHVQALQYMRRLCSHPALVLDLSLAQHKAAATRVLGSTVTSSAKALATGKRGGGNLAEGLAGG